MTFRTADDDQERSGSFDPTERVAPRTPVMRSDQQIDRADLAANRRSGFALEIPWQQQSPPAGLDQQHETGAVVVEPGRGDTRGI